MEPIMTRLSSQRGVSLMLLIVMITVFAGVAVGVVTLLRARHESYPYQVQSYQAYTLAHAGIEFAIRYARENTQRQRGLLDPSAELLPVRRSPVQIRQRDVHTDVRAQ